MAQPNSAKSQGSTRPDFATIGGLILALGGIVAGLLMEGGKLQDIAQVTSALIVLGGTLGAVMITTPLPVLTSRREAVQFGDLRQIARDRRHYRGNHRLCHAGAQERHRVA